MSVKKGSVREALIYNKTRTSTKQHFNSFFEYIAPLKQVVLP